MTDLFREDTATFARMGIIAEVVDGDLRMRLEPQAELLHHGLLRASVASLMIDLVAGFALEAPGSWVLTTDLSVRMRPEPAPRSVSTRCTVLRQGGRSATAVVDLVDGDDR